MFNQYVNNKSRFFIWIIKANPSPGWNWKYATDTHTARYNINRSAKRLSFPVYVYVALSTVDNIECIIKTHVFRRTYV